MLFYIFAHMSYDYFSQCWRLFALNTVCFTCVCVCVCACLLTNVWDIMCACTKHLQLLIKKRMILIVFLPFDYLATWLCLFYNRFGGGGGLVTTVTPGLILKRAPMFLPSHTFQSRDRDNVEGGTVVDDQRGLCDNRRFSVRRSVVARHRSAALEFGVRHRS